MLNLTATTMHNTQPPRYPTSNLSSRTKNPHEEMKSDFPAPNSQWPLLNTTLRNPKRPSTTPTLAQHPDLASHTSPQTGVGEGRIIITIYLPLDGLARDAQPCASRDCAMPPLGSPKRHDFKVLQCTASFHQPQKAPEAATKHSRADCEASDAPCADCYHRYEVSLVPRCWWQGALHIVASFGTKKLGCRTKTACCVTVLQLVTPNGPCRAPKPNHSRAVLQSPASSPRYARPNSTWSGRLPLLRAYSCSAAGGSNQRATRCHRSPAAAQAPQSRVP